MSILRPFERKAAEKPELIKDEANGAIAVAAKTETTSVVQEGAADAPAKGMEKLALEAAEPGDSKKFAPATPETVKKDQAGKDAVSVRKRIRVPFEDVAPVVRRNGLWAQIKALACYMIKTEVHTYAFSVAANVILALFPFIVLMLTLAQRVFHSTAMVAVLWDLMHSMLPVSQDFVMRNMTVLAHPRKGTQFFSVFMLLVTTTGVFLPLEVALNEVWGVKKNRNYLMNQLVSLGLAAGVGVLVLASVGLTTVQRTVMGWIFFGHTDNVVFNFAAGGVLRGCAVIASILMFFLVYWILPHRKIPAASVLPTAIVVGVLWELAKNLYVLVLPKLDFEAVYGPFRVTVALMMWAFLSGLLLLAGAHFSANRYALKVAREAEDDAPAETAQVEG